MACNVQTHPLPVHIHGSTLPLGGALGHVCAAGGVPVRACAAVQARLAAVPSAMHSSCAFGAAGARAQVAQMPVAG